MTGSVLTTGKMADQAPTEEKKMENDTTEPATKDDEQNDRVRKSDVQ